MSNKQSSRILAVEVRAARFGYALLEKPRRVLDFGAVWFDSPTIARLRIRRLFKVSHPTLLVLRKVSSVGSQRVLKKKFLAGIIRSEARKASIPVAYVTEVAFKGYFDSHSCRTKYHAAIFLTKLFPEIGWRLPPRRKFYEPEPLAMIYFDSIALVAVYLEGVEEAIEKGIHDAESFRRPPGGVARS